MIDKIECGYAAIDEKKRGSGKASILKKLPLTSFRIIFPLLISGFSLALGLGFGLLYFQTLGKAHVANKQLIGDMYASQLAESSEQALILKDKLSLQVKAAELIRNPGISGAAVMDSKQNYLSRSPSYNPNAGELFTAPILIDGENAGFAEVVLDSNYLDAPLREFILAFLVLWSLLFLGLAAVAYFIGKSWSQQVNAIMGKLPGSLQPDRDLPELTRLETALAPLFVNNIQRNNQTDKNPASPDDNAEFTTGLAVHSQAILSVKIKNLSRLQAELSSDNFASLMVAVDDMIQFILKLYEAERLATHDATIYLVTSSTKQEDDHCLRALYSGVAFMKLIEGLQANRGLKIDCTLAITSDQTPNAGNRLQHDLQREKQIGSAVELLEIAATGEILLDRKTGTHPALDDTALLEPLTPDQKMFRCEGLAETAENLVKRQLAFYRGISTQAG